MVYCGERVPRGALEVPNPLIVVGVLSPSTGTMDIGAKLQGYLALPSVQHYLLIDPDRTLIIHHKRGTGDGIATRIVSGAILRLKPPDSISMSPKFSPPEAAHAPTRDVVRLIAATRAISAPATRNAATSDTRLDSARMRMICAAATATASWTMPKPAM